MNNVIKEKLKKFEDQSTLKRNIGDNLYEFILYKFGAKELEEKLK